MRCTWHLRAGGIVALSIASLLLCACNLIFGYDEGLQAQGGSGVGATTTGGGGSGAAGGLSGSGGTGAAGAAGGSVLPGPHCEGLADNCGPADDGSCCAADVVPGGTFNRSNDPAYPATVSSFVLDRYEITVGRFRKFVEAGYGTQASPPVEGSGEHPHVAGSGWQSAWNAELEIDTPALRYALKCGNETWTDEPGANETRPINCFTWFEAFAFCIWDGGRLATEAEWNYAAACGVEQRFYPWSNPPDSTTITCDHASYDCQNNSCGDGTFGCAITDFIHVGHKPDGNGCFGHAELGGNVWDWLLDWYETDRPYPTPCVNCVDSAPSSENKRACRGGGRGMHDEFYLRTSSRAGCIVDDRAGYNGARCARDQ